MVKKFDREFNIGNPGIDTQLERDIIEYRPDIEYSKESPLTLPDVSEDFSEEQMEEVLGGPSVVSTWEELAEVIKQVNDLEKTLSEKLRGASVPIPSQYISSIQKAAEKFGYEITDAIPFELYKLTFKEPDSPESVLIQDIYEDYQADVNGNLNAELYTEVIEIQKDLEDITDFARKGLFAQIVPLDELAGELDESKLEEIHQREKEMIEQYADLLKKNKENEDLLNDLIMYEYGSERYFQVENELKKGRRRAFELEKKLFTKNEVLDLLKRKASDIADHIELIRDSIDLDPLKEDRYDILYHISRQFDGKDKMIREMGGMKALLKFSIDAKKGEVFSLRQNLRGLAGQKHRRKIHQNLINSIHLRNQVLIGIQDWVGNFDGVPDNSMFDRVMGYVTEGLRRAELKYRQDASDFHKIHTMNAELRQEKLASVIDKDIARQSYKMFANISHYAKDAFVSRPGEEDFGKWLREVVDKIQTT